MSTEANKAVVRHFYEAIWNQGDLARIDAVLAPDFVDHDPMEGATGRRGIEPKALITMWRAAFPDVALTIEDQLAEGDQVLTRWRATGTNRGSFLGRPPTGKQVTITGMWLDRVQDGQIVESWANWDTLGLLQQLGWVPSLG